MGEKKSKAVLRKKKESVFGGKPVGLLLGGAGLVPPLLIAFPASL